MKARATARLAAALIVVAAVTGAFLRPAGAVQFTNSTPITMPALGATVPAPWPGNPYPSTIAVAGLSGTITDVNVILHGFDCSARTVDFAYPEDIDLLLVGPTGANSVILSDVGGANAPTANQFTDITITLDDEAAAPLPADTQLSAGTYRPLDDDDDPSEQVAVDTFPAPAPAPTGGSALSVFDGTAPNGTWSLYMADDYAGPDNCRILRGWTIDITTSEGTTTTTAPTTTTTAPTTSTTAGPNRPPVANNDAYTTPQGTALTVPAPGVLANDSDPDGDPLTAGMPTNPSNGTLNLSTNGGFTYTPNPGFSGTDSFTYMAHDPHGGMTTATVTITVTATTTTTTAPPTTTTTTPGALTCDGLAATIVGTPGDDRITGTPERDVIVALGGHDMVHG
ncbi:MAG TPA: Ig-like domain-containing protein, partial [Acidimicrobiales bacterium]|nr:Ig-like domain-containing protein [Acidimicrobiales bacterium]